MDLRQGRINWLYLTSVIPGAHEEMEQFTTECTVSMFRSNALSAAHVQSTYKHITNKEMWLDDSEYYIMHAYI